MIPILLIMATQAMALPVSTVLEVPLTRHDILLVRAGGDSSISTTGTDKQTCLLTPASATGSGAGSGCTWRSEQKCKSIKTVRSIPLYSPGCEDDGHGVVVTKCKESVATVPVVHNTQVCSIQGTKDCLGPCYNCPVFCKKTQQSLCEISHVVKRQVITRRECETDKAGNCREVVRRLERDVIKMSEDCHNQEVEELCAPVNCKFVNLKPSCKEKNSSMLVELLERQCTICEPILEEKEEVEDECQEALTDECESEPLSKPWKKFCSDNHSEMEEFVQVKQLRLVKEEPRSQELHNKRKLEENNFLPTLLNRNFEMKTLNPRVKSHSHPTNTDSMKTSEMDMKLIKLVQSEEAIIHEELQMIKNLNSKPTNINLNVKYSFVPNPTSSPPPIETTTIDPIIHLLENVIHLPDDKEDITTDTKLPKVLPTVQTPHKSEVIATTIRLPTTTTQNTIQNTTKEETTNYVERQIRKATKTMSATDFLRLCFTSGLGCDFGRSSFGNEILTTEPSTTPRQETTTSIPIPLIITTEPSSNIRERLKERVKLCFFSHICNDPSTASQIKPIIRQPRVIAANTTQRSEKEKTRSRSNTIRAQIQARAKACFFEGKCN